MRERYETRSRRVDETRYARDDAPLPAYYADAFRRSVTRHFDAPFALRRLRQRYHERLEFTFRYATLEPERRVHATTLPSTYDVYADAIIDVLRQRC